MFLINGGSQSFCISERVCVAGTTLAQIFHEFENRLHIGRKSHLLFAGSDFLADPGEIEKSQANLPRWGCALRI